MPNIELFSGILTIFASGMYELLNKINSPADLRKLDRDRLGELCGEIRSYIIECCSGNPGHLASSLGAVELIVGFHYVFDTPGDKIVFDVGHQAYAHKIITGRREQFKDIRTSGGLSGFPLPAESEYDAFVAGHASNSVSAALGLSEAAKLAGESSRIAALIGDGALTGGLAFEGLNNAGASRSDLLVILNDNNQSIDGNLGGLHNYLLKITTSQGYNKLKNKVWHSLGDSRFRAMIQRWTRTIKSWFIKKSGGDLFESLGFRYFGPIDGNDIDSVVDTLQKLRNLKGPRILHSFTVKGKGYAPAEADPVVWHAPGRFDPASGERATQERSIPRYQDVFGKVLCELAEADSRVVGITPAMATGCGMTAFARQFPSRFFDVGIEEEHAVTFSAGLAAGGMKPFCNIYSSFSQRSYDQIIHDVALPGLPVTICLDRAGLVGEDGPTHQGAFDVPALRCIPGTIISAPRNEAELRNLMYTALQHDRGPFIIRYPRGSAEGVAWEGLPLSKYEIGKAEVLKEGARVALIATGPVANRALEAAEKFGDSVGVYYFRFIKPLDTCMLRAIAERYETVITAEDGAVSGGLFGAVSEYMASNAPGVRVEALGIGDSFVAQASQSSQRAEWKIDTAGIEKILQKCLEI